MSEQNKYIGQVEESVKLRVEAEQGRERAVKVKKELRQLCQDGAILIYEAQLIIREGKKKAIVG